MNTHLLRTVWAAVVALAALAGCATQTKITVHSSPQTNDGNTMYMAVRAWDGKPTSGERYQEMAAKLFNEPPDPSIIATQPILPGTEKMSVTIDEALAKEVVIYFFFTDPGPGWQVPLRKPLPAEVEIDLGAHQVENIRVRPH
jgi:azurin